MNKNKYNKKKLTYEDRFARCYYCQHARLNQIRFDKKHNKKHFRRILKKEFKKEREEE